MTPLDDFALDVLRRCRWARAHNDARPSGAWSTGEQLAVALVLNDHETLAELDYAWAQAAQRVADGMWSPPADFNAWLGAMRAALDEAAR
jgi:hypothetical protein